MPKIFASFFNWWYERRRRRDLEILWPLCKQNAKSLEDARTAFLLHASKDSAWRHLEPLHAARIINALK